ANPTGAVFRGQFIGRTVEVRPSVTVVGSDSTCDLPVGTLTGCADESRSPGETDVDCGGVCGATCELGAQCLSGQDCSSSACISGVCAPSAPACEAGTAVDLGTPGTQRTVSGNSCVRVQEGYPAWWGDERVMQLQSMFDGVYPIPGTWESSCTGGGGSFVLERNWSSVWLGPTSGSCATVVRLNGQPDAITLRYY